MSEVTMTNTQNSTGDTLEERLKALEREKRGVIDDLRAEREKRQQYERRLEEMEKVLNSAANEPEAIDPQSEVNRLAQKPKEFILEVVKPELERRDQEILRLRQEKRFDQAYQWLAKQEKKDTDEVYGSEIEQDIARITKEHGMGMMDPLEGTKAAYKILQTERRIREEEEAKRNQAISNNSTHTVQNPSSAGTRSFTRAQIAAMSPYEFEQNRAAILDAQAKGLIA